MLGKIFDMFTQVDWSLDRTQGGLGIGLSLVKGLVEMHGGSVEARSEGYGRGSEFIVRVPIAIELCVEFSPASSGAVERGTRRRVLVVDDNRDTAVSLAMILDMLGNDTRTAHEGAEAVDVAETFRPHVILLDIGMPKMNGYEVARRVREQPWGTQVALVAITGWGQEDIRQRSQEAGFDRHLVKPVEPSSLREVLADLDNITPAANA
jgi:CheY-like chemotaxis protein